MSFETNKVMLAVAKNLLESSKSIFESSKKMYETATKMIESAIELLEKGEQTLIKRESAFNQIDVEAMASNPDSTKLPDPIEVIDLTEVEENEALCKIRRSPKRDSPTKKSKANRREDPNRQGTKRKLSPTNNVHRKKLREIPNTDSKTDSLPVSTNAKSKPTWVAADSSITTSSACAAFETRKQKSVSDDNVTPVTVSSNKQLNTAEHNTSNIFLTKSSCKNDATHDSSTAGTRKQIKTSGNEQNIATDDSVAVLSKQPFKVTDIAEHVPSNVLGSTARKNQIIAPNIAKNSSATITVPTSIPEKKKQVKTPNRAEIVAHNLAEIVAPNIAEIVPNNLKTAVTPRRFQSNFISVSERLSSNGGLIRSPNQYDQIGSNKEVVKSDLNAISEKKLKILPQITDAIDPQLANEPDLQSPSAQQSSEGVRYSMTVVPPELQHDGGVKSDSVSVPQWKIVFKPQFVTQDQTVATDNNSTEGDGNQIFGSEIASNHYATLTGKSASHHKIAVARDIASKRQIVETTRTPVFEVVSHVKESILRNSRQDCPVEKDPLSLDVARCDVYNNDCDDIENYVNLDQNSVRESCPLETRQMNWLKKIPALSTSNNQRIQKWVTLQQKVASTEHAKIRKYRDFKMSLNQDLSRCSTPLYQGNEEPPSNKLLKRKYSAGKKLEIFNGLRKEQKGAMMMKACEVMLANARKERLNTCHDVSTNISVPPSSSSRPDPTLKPDSNFKSDPKSKPSRFEPGSSNLQFMLGFNKDLVCD